MGVLGFTRIDDDETRRRDELVAEDLTRRELAERRQDIGAIIGLGEGEPAAEPARPEKS